MDILSDNKPLLCAFKQGDSTALTRIYNIYLPEVYAFLSGGFAFSAQGNRYFFNGYKELWYLESVLQDIFIKAFSEPARNAYDGIRPYRNYLFRIARNTVIDNFRSQKRELLELDDGAATEVEIVREHGETANPESRLFAKQLTEQVAVFRDTLPATLRTFFDIRFAECESIEQIASRFKWSEHRVKRREKQVKKQFFKWLKARGYFEGYRY